MARQALTFFFSEEGATFRGFLLDEVVNAADALPSFLATLLPCCLATLLPCYLDTLPPSYLPTFVPHPELRRALAVGMDHEQTLTRPCAICGPIALYM